MKFITIGEIMMRLSPPNYDKIVSTHDFIVNYGGAEANVAVSLACLGVDSTLFTVLPNTDLGKSTISYLKANDVHTRQIIKSEGRMGITDQSINVIIEDALDKIGKIDNA